MQNHKFHTPVLVKEVVEILTTNVHLNDQAWIIDATLGSGGHTLELIRLGKNVLGIEMDEKMLEIANGRLEKACPVPDKCGAYKTYHGNFKDIDIIAKEVGIDKIAGILIDLGVSNLQLTSTERGFSFSNPDADLDMRIDQENMGLKASDLLNALRENQLIEVFNQTMDFGEARALTKKVLRGRAFKKYVSVDDFLGTCESVVKRKNNLHPATRAFLALRMAVNSELENLEEVLPKAISLLMPGGRLAIISFHSGEDKVVKHVFGKSENLNDVSVITKTPLIPSEDEINDNPRSRSAKLRAVEKL